MKHISNYLIVLSIGFILQFPVVGQTLWQWQNPIPQGNTLYSVFFADEQTGYATGEYGTIIKTTNGGQDWILLTTGVTKTLRTIFFTDAQTGYAIGGNVLLKTIDGGDNWSSSTIGSTANLFNTIYFVNTDTGYAAGSNTVSEALVFQTTDGGASWAPQNIPIGAQSINSIFFVNADTGYTAGGDFGSEILKTTNGGATWTISESGNFDYLNDLHFINATTGMAVGNDGMIIRTLNGGTTWNFVNNSGNFNELFAVHFPTPTTGYAVAQRAVLKTIDGGSNWSVVQTVTERNLLSGFFTAQDSGTVVGLGGYIQSTGDGGTTWFDNTPVPMTIQSTFFLNADTGYFSGSGNSEGAIYKTTDGGANFTKLSLPSSITPIFSIFFTNRDTGYAPTILNTNRVVLKTTNGGTSWAPVPSNTNEIITSIHFPTSDTGYAVGTNGALVKTIDAGESWTALSTGTTNTLNSVFFVDGHIGYISGDLATFLKTTNGGLSWSPQNPGIIGQINSVFFTAHDTGYTVGAGKISRTTDGGLNWQAINTASMDLLRSVHFANASAGCAVGESGTILRTTDGGLNWNLEESGTNNSLFSVFLPSEEVVYTVGLAGTILKREGSANLAPSITSTPDTVAIVDSLYSYQVTATDPNGDLLTFRLLTSPSWLSIDSTAGLIQGTPSISNVGDTTVTVTVLDHRGGSDQQTYTLSVMGPVAIEEPSEAVLTRQFQLDQNYPNPFNPTTTITYYLPIDSDVQIEIFNLVGQKIRTLLDQPMPGGIYQIEWDGRNNAGSAVASGIYIYRMKADNYISVKKMTLLK